MFGVFFCFFCSLIDRSLGSVAATVKVQNKLKAAVVFKTDFGEEKKVKPIFKTCKNTFKTDFEKETVKIL